MTNAKRAWTLAATAAAALLLAVAAPATASDATGPGATADTGLLIGARAKLAQDHGSPAELAADLATAQDRIGPIQVTRVFYGNLPPKHTRISGPDVQEIISFKGDERGNLATFVASLTTEKVAFHHEPEGDYADGAAFVAAWTRWRDRFKAADPDVPFGMIAGGYQYRAGGKGVNGSFLPPSADWYGFDTYRPNTRPSNAIVPLAQVDEFGTWMDLTEQAAAPGAPQRWITEYGRGWVGETELPGTAKLRAETIPADVEYARQLGVKGIVWWLSNYGPDGHAWTPVGQRFYRVMQAQPRG